MPGGVFCLITWPSRTMVAMVNLGMMQINLVLWIHIWLWRNLEAVHVSGHGFAEELPRASYDTSISGPVWTGPALDSKSFVSWSLFTSVSLSSIWASVFLEELLSSSSHNFFMQLLSIHAPPLSPFWSYLATWMCQFRTPGRSSAYTVSYLSLSLRCNLCQR